MQTIYPISSDQKALVIAETERFIALANSLFGKKLASISVQFDLIGRTAGMYKVKRLGLKTERVIRYNPYLFAKYWDDNFTVTVPHEVAHYVVDRLYGMGKVKPHGDEWHKVMAVFDVNASRTANFDLAGIPQRSQRMFDYLCQCREHQLTVRRHNKIVCKKAQYLCRYCKSPLQRA